MLTKQPFWLVLAVVLCTACGRTSPEVLVPDNNVSNYEGVSTLQVRNYVNRLYIDLLGREPLNDEMDQEVQLLRDADLAIAARETLVLSLQTGETGGGLDSAGYKTTFFYRWYELSKARMLEGVSDEEINNQIGIIGQDALKDSLNGDLVGYQTALAEIEKLESVLQSRDQWLLGEITVSEMFGRMQNNYFYDLINMNTFNFIRASFDDLFLRLPTQAEFDAAFPVIEYNQTSIILGQSASNKDEYINILTHSLEFYEGMIRWAYQSLLSRDARTEEVFSALEEFITTQDFLKVQRQILTSDEYANF